MKSGDLLQDKLVLVVDDDRATLLRTCRILERAGYDRVEFQPIDGNETCFGGDVQLAQRLPRQLFGVARQSRAIHTALADKISRLRTHYQICTAADLEPALAEAVL